VRNTQGKHSCKDPPHISQPDSPFCFYCCQQWSRSPLTTHIQTQHPSTTFQYLQTLFIYLFALTILYFIVIANASTKIYYPCRVSHHIFIYCFNMLILLCFIDPSRCASHLASKSKYSTSLVDSWVTFIFVMVLIGTCKIVV